MSALLDAADKLNSAASELAAVNVDFSEEKDSVAGLLESVAGSLVSVANALDAAATAFRDSLASS